jgi:hypothetical protein
LEEALLSEVAPVVRTDRLAVGLPHLPFALCLYGSSTSTSRAHACFTRPRPPPPATPTRRACPGRAPRPQQPHRQASQHVHHAPVHRPRLTGPRCVAQARAAASLTALALPEDPPLKTTSHVAKLQVSAVSRGRRLSSCASGSAGGLHGGPWYAPAQLPSRAASKPAAACMHEPLTSANAQEGTPSGDSARQRGRKDSRMPVRGNARDSPQGRHTEPRLAVSLCGCVEAVLAHAPSLAHARQPAVGLRTPTAADAARSTAN